ncbi:MAG TPA: HipA domain-containing protein [Chitinophagaceae bacterium]|nr:HipA domain-containing protein [Chitinophagaceae bacterium]
MKNYKKKYSKYQAVNTENWALQEGEISSINRCLYCYEEINETDANFHQSCNKKFFGQLQTPLIDYQFSELESLAEKVIYSKMAVAGVQAKISLSLHRKQEKNEIKKLTIVGLYGDYILKPPSTYYPFLPEVEDLTMHLAEVCGLKTVPHSLIQLKDATVCYITKRVDRTKSSKLHMEDMCQISERLTEDKYKGSHEQIAKLILKHSCNPVLDVTNFYELVIFSFLTGNADMHLKNFSLLENKALKGYTLSPAYDLLATALVNPSDKEELALTLNGKKKNLNYQDFLKAYETSGLSKKVLDTTLDNFFYCLFEMKIKIANSFLNEDLKTQFIQLITERGKRILKVKE